MLILLLLLLFSFLFKKRLHCLLLLLLLFEVHNISGGRCRTQGLLVAGKDNLATIATGFRFQIVGRGTLIVLGSHDRDNGLRGRHCRATPSGHERALYSCALFEHEALVVGLVQPLPHRFPFCFLNSMFHLFGPLLGKH